MFQPVACMPVNNRWPVNRPHHQRRACRCRLPLLTLSFGSVQDEVAVEDVCKQIIKQWTDYSNQSKAKRDSDDGILITYLFLSFYNPRFLPQDSLSLAGK